jgi:hypothetical protein
MQILPPKTVGVVELNTAIAHKGYGMLSAASVAEWAGCALSELQALSPDWDEPGAGWAGSSSMRETYDLITNRCTFLKRFTGRYKNTVNKIMKLFHDDFRFSSLWSQR